MSSSRTSMKSALIALVSACAVGFPMPSTAAEAESTTLTIDNDVFTGSDRNYTNGLGVTWTSRDLKTYDDQSFVRKWGKMWSFLPFVSDESYKTYASWSVVQEIYTSDDIDNPNPPESDQPYAGILYVDSLLYARKERWVHAWELKLGVVGSSSQAERTQRWFHRLIGSDEPQGWHTQLPNEPVINVAYTVSHLAAAGHVGATTEWRIVPVGNVGLGTYFTGAGVGLYGEIGWNLVDALGGVGLRAGLNSAPTVGVGPVPGWSVAFFGGLAGFGVVHYLPLDGTVFRESRSVDTKPFVGMGSVGVSVRHGRFVFGFARWGYTKAFDTEPHKIKFGTLSLSWYY